MSQSSLVSYPKQIFYDIVFKEIKAHLQDLKQERWKPGLTMIMQVFDHSSCRLASKHLLKEFLDEHTQEGDENPDQELDAKDARKKQIRDHLRTDGDRSSIFYTDEDFKDLLA